MLPWPTLALGLAAVLGLFFWSRKQLRAGKVCPSVTWQSPRARRSGGRSADMLFAVPLPEVNQRRVRLPFLVQCALNSIHATRSLR